MAKTRHLAGGLALHTILPHPTDKQRMLIAVSAAGVYATDDGGASWHDIANGVPSDFGFPCVAHPRDVDTAWVIPLESDGFRCTPDAKLRVHRTRDGGKKWHALKKGLPQEHALETVLRDSMAGDALDPAGVYFGTRRGEVWASSDEGDSWKKIAEGLPPVTCVKVALLGDAAERHGGAGKAARRHPPPGAPRAEETVTIVFFIPPALRGFAGGAAEVRVDGLAPPTVRDALAALFARHPALRDRVQDELGRVRQHVNVFVGDEAIRYTGGLDTTLDGRAAALEISIIPAVSGGLGDPRWA
jgi:molybdopterin converting factor small subunit